MWTLTYFFDKGNPIITTKTVLVDSEYPSQFFVIYVSYPWAQSCNNTDIDEYTVFPYDTCLFTYSYNHATKEATSEGSFKYSIEGNNTEDFNKNFSIVTAIMNAILSTVSPSYMLIIHVVSRDVAIRILMLTIWVTAKSFHHFPRS